MAIRILLLSGCSEDDADIAPSRNGYPRNPADIYAGHSGAVFAAAWSPDGKRVASGGDDLGLQVWNATTGSLYYIAYGHKNVDGGGILSAAWSPDGTRIASGGVDATVQVIDAATRGHIATYSGQTDWIFGLAWSPDGSEIVSAGQDNTVQIWLPH
jgi:WD40 repeat protein